MPIQPRERPCTILDRIRLDLTLTAECFGCHIAFQARKQPLWTWKASIDAADVMAQGMSWAPGQRCEHPMTSA